MPGTKTPPRTLRSNKMTDSRDDASSQGHSPLSLHPPKKRKKERKKEKKRQRHHGYRQALQRWVSAQSRSLTQYLPVLAKWCKVAVTFIATRWQTPGNPAKIETVWDLILSRKSGGLISRVPAGPSLLTNRGDNPGPTRDKLSSCLMAKWPWSPKLLPLSTRWRKEKTQRKTFEFQQSYHTFALCLIRHWSPRPRSHTFCILRHCLLRESLFIYLWIYLCIYLFIYLMNAYSPINLTGSPQGFSL